MRIHDISLPISPALPVWPTDQAVSLRPTLSLSSGDVANASHLSCSVHAGTHVDAPIHYIEGAPGVDSLRLEVLIGPAQVCSLPHVDQVSAEALELLNLPSEVERLLLRTRNSELWMRGVQEFTPDFVALTPDGAEWIVRRGIRLIGIDYLSIQRFRDSNPTTHRTLLKAGVVIVEGLDLSHVQPGLYRLICLPLRIVGGDGAPARAVLLEA